MNFGLLKYKMFTAGLAALISSLPANAVEFKAKVISVQDGDSLTILHNGKAEKVILYGIDCPELKQDFGEQSREFTTNSCKGKIVSLDVRGKDRHERTIARVFLPDGSLLNLELLKLGLAWWSDKYAPEESEFKQSQIEAKSKHIGLWSSSSAIAPWIFRNGEKSVQAEIKPSAPE